MAVRSSNHLSLLIVFQFLGEFNAKWENPLG